MDVAMPFESERRARLVEFAERMRHRHARRAAGLAAIRWSLAAAIPAIAVAWIVPALALHAAAVTLAVAVLGAALAAWAARRVPDAMLLGVLDGEGDPGLGELGDELATWLERDRRRADAAMRAAGPMDDWLADDLDRDIAALPATAVRAVGRRSLGRLRWLVPIVLLLLLAWLLSFWWQPPWSGLLGGRPTRSTGGAVSVRVHGVVREGVLAVPQAIVTGLDEVRRVLADAGRAAPAPGADEPPELLAAELDTIDSRVPNAIVRLFEKAREPGVNPSAGIALGFAVAEPDGTYELPRVPPGDYSITVARPPGWTIDAKFEVTVPEPARDLGLDVWLPVVGDPPPSGTGGKSEDQQPQDPPEDAPPKPPEPDESEDQPAQPPPSEPPAPLLDLPENQVFVVPQFIDDGPSRRMRAHVAEVGGDAGPAGQPAAQRTEGGDVSPPPPVPQQVEFERAAERARQARHVPEAERAIVRRFFDLLREAAK